MFDFKPGTVVPVGHIIALTSWENDADDYRTITHLGCSTCDVEFFKKVYHLFNSDEYGNSDFEESLVSEAYMILENNPELLPAFEKFMGINLKSVDPESYEINDRPESIMNMIHKNITSNAVQYDYDFIRVLESVEIFYNDVEYTVPETKFRKIETLTNY